MGAAHPYYSHNVFFGYSNLIDLYYGYFSGSLTAGSRIYINNPWSDRWFTVEQATSEIQVNATTINNGPNYLGGGYYINDQTFLEVNYLTDNTGYNLETCLRGSYLFDIGLFAGLSYYSWNNGGYYYSVFSPGYRINLSNQGYISTSIDYIMSNYGSNNEVLSYEIGGVYYPEKAKIFGEVSIPNKGTFPSFNTIYLLGVNYQAADNLVCGLSYLNLDDIYYILGGLTYSPNEFIVNGMIGTSHSNSSNATVYDIGASYRFSDSFGAGIEYMKYSDVDQGQLSGRLDFSIEDGVLEVSFFPENDVFPQIITAVYKLSI